MERAECFWTWLTYPGRWRRRCRNVKWKHVAFSFRSACGMPITRCGDHGQRMRESRESERQREWESGSERQTVRLSAWGQDENAARNSLKWVAHCRRGARLITDRCLLAKFLINLWAEAPTERERKSVRERERAADTEGDACTVPCPTTFFTACPV